MLLIVTERGDLTSDFLILELEKRGIEFVRFNTEDYPTAVKIDWSPKGALLELGAQTYDLKHVESVWYRRPQLPKLPSDYPPDQARWASAEANEALHGIWRTLDALWVNHPDANRVGESKPAQLQVACFLGFDIPPTLVTNDPKALESFIKTHRDVVCKPLLDGLVPEDGSELLFFTSKVEPEALKVHDLGPEPYLFQGLVKKDFDVRVTVIGEKVFAVGIDSQTEEEAELDWRRGAHSGLAHRPFQLPEEIAHRCIALCRHYGLHFGAIDLAVRPDGGYTFFEINPNGQWAWLEEETGLPLRSTLTDLLVMKQKG